MTTLKHGNHRIDYTASQDFLLSVGGQPFKICKAGSGVVRIRNASGKLSVDPQKAKVDFQVRTHETNDEPRDNEPTPPPAAPPNYLAAMRQQVRQSMGVTREAFADIKTTYEHIFDETGGNPDGLVRQNDPVIDDGDHATQGEGDTSDVTSSEEVSE